MSACADVCINASGSGILFKQYLWILLCGVFVFVIGTSGLGV